MNTKIFWTRVKACTKEKGISQLDLSKSCKLTYGTFRNWISKGVNPPLIYADRIAKNLGVSLEYLINGQGKDSVSKTNEKVLLLLKEAEVNLKKIRRD